tara:strand:- start:313 stop:1218 length:906 start_codon:yes stop_codon:yes gene_type:complete
MNQRRCKKSGCKDSNGNCLVIGSDNLPIQCVGPWVEDKYYFLVRYLNASCEARRKFSSKNNAVFIDLFSGPGLCIIKETQEEIQSGSVRAFLREEASFNEFYFFDISKSNIDALKRRIGSNPNCNFKLGDSNVLVKRLVEELLAKHYRYHFAFVDPFGPKGLKFETLSELAKLARMDMLIHFPIGPIKRNIQRWIKGNKTILDDFMGTSEWIKMIDAKMMGKTFRILIDLYTKQLKSIGYKELKLAVSDSTIYSGIPTVPIKNTKDVDLYVLILASKHSLGQKIWNSVIKIDRKGQKNLPF